MKQEESKLGDKLYVERDQTADFDDLEDSGSSIVPYTLKKEEVVDEENSFNRQKNDSIRSMGFEASDENVSPSPNQQDEDAENNPLKSVVLNSLLQRRELAAETPQQPLKLLNFHVLKLGGHVTSHFSEITITSD